MIVINVTTAYIVNEEAHDSSGQAESTAAVNFAHEEMIEMTEKNSFKKTTS